MWLDLKLGGWTRNRWERRAETTGAQRSNVSRDQQEAGTEQQEMERGASRAQGEGLTCTDGLWGSRCRSDQSQCRRTHYVVFKVTDHLCTEL